MSGFHIFQCKTLEIWDFTWSNYFFMRMATVDKVVSKEWIKKDSVLLHHCVFLNFSFPSSLTLVRRYLRVIRLIDKPKTERGVVLNSWKNSYPSTTSFPLGQVPREGVSKVERLFDKFTFDHIKNIDIEVGQYLRVSNSFWNSYRSRERWTKSWMRLLKTPSLWVQHEPLLRMYVVVCFPKMPKLWHPRAMEIVRPKALIPWPPFSSVNLIEG